MMRNGNQASRPLGQDVIGERGIDAMMRDESGWIGWRQHLGNSNVESLVAATALPRRDEEWLHPVPELVDVVMKEYFVALMMLDQRSRWWLCGARGDWADAQLPLLQSTAARRRCTDYIQRFVCYALRVATVMRRDWSSPDKDDACRLFNWHSKEQQHETRELRRRLVDLHESGGGEGDEYLRGPLRNMLREFVLHDTGRKPFRSALVHFLALLGVDQRCGRLRGPEHFSSVLAGMVYCARAVAGGNLLPTADPMEFREKRRRYLDEQSMAPIGFMLRLLSFYETGPAGPIANSDEAVEPDRFRRMVLGVVGDAEELLWQELVGDESGPEGRITIPLDEDADAVHLTARYLTLTSSFAFLGGGHRGVAADRILSGPVGRRLCRERPLSADAGEEAGLEDQTWRSHVAWARRWIIPEQAQAYLERVERFMELLLLASHITGGPQPADAADITALPITDVVVTEGQVILATSLGLPHLLLLPWRVGQLMAVHLVYLRPFVEFLSVAVLGGGHSVDRVWGNDRQGTWEADRLTQVLASETGRWLGTALTTSDYHRVAAAMRTAAGAPPGEGVAPDVGLNGHLELPQSPLALHSRVRARTRAQCEYWHRFLGLASCRGEGPGVIQADGNPGVIQADGSPGVIQADGSPGVIQADGSPGVIQEQRQLAQWLDDVMEPCVACQRGLPARHPGHQSAKSPRCEENISLPAVDWFQDMFWHHPNGPKSCPRCGLGSFFCMAARGATGRCRWQQAVPIVLASMALTQVGRGHLFDLGFYGWLPDREGLKARDRRTELRCAEYARWLTAPHPQPVWGHRLSNAMVALIKMGKQSG